MARVPRRSLQLEATGVAALFGLVTAAQALVQTPDAYPFTMFYPPAGVVFGYLILRGPAAAPAAVLAMIGGAAIGLPRPFINEPFAATSTNITIALVLTLCSYPLHQIWRRRSATTSVFGTLTLFMITGLVAAPLACAGAVYLVANLLADPAPAVGLTRLFLGAATSIATLTPVTVAAALVVSGQRPEIYRRPIAARGQILLPAIAIVSAPALALALPNAQLAELWLLPLATIPLVWICVNGNLFSTGISIAVSALVLGSVTIGLHGEGSALYRAQVVMLASTVATLYLLAAGIRLARTWRTVDAADSRFRALVAAAPAVVTRIGAAGVNADDPDQPALRRPDVRAAIASQSAATVRWQSADGRNLVTQVTPIPDGETLVVTTPSSVADAAEAALAWERTHDRASGLPNRDLLLAASASLVAGGRPASLVVIDTDHLMRRSMLLGADGGAMMRALASRLVQALAGDGGDEVMLARTGDDQLVLLTQQDVAAGSEAASRLLRAANEALTADGVRIPVSASIGMARLAPGSAPAPVLRHAEIAAQTAREQGRSGIVRADGPASRTAADQARLGTEVLAAVEQGELDVVYQPDVDPADGSLRGLEALVRWRRRAGNALTTEDFVRTAEEIGAVAAIDDWVMRTAVSQLGQWRRELGIAAIELGINASVRSLTPDLPERLDDVCRRAGVPAGLIRLEVTETALGDDSSAVAVLREARALGFRIALDDFGIGYASLSRLRQLPVDVIKLDRSFIATLTEDPATQTLVGMVLGLAEPLQLDVVVEGVETEAQRDILVRLGCERAQGFLFAPPAPVSALREILLDDRAVPISP